MRRWVIAGVVTVLGCVGAVDATSIFAFQGPWVTPAVDLSAINRNAIAPQVAVALDGTTTAVWYRSNGTKEVVQASTRSPGGQFTAPIDLSAGDQNAGDPQVAIAPDGTTTAVWIRFNGTNYVVQASTRPPGGQFAAPVNLSAGDHYAIAPQVAIAPDGTTTAVWLRANGGVQASTRPPGGAFTTPVDLSAGDPGLGSPQVAIAPDGTTTVVWSRSNGTSYVVQASTRAPGGAFTAPIDLSDSGQNAIEPQVAVAPDGTATVVWSLSNGTNNVVQASTRAPGAAFTAPVNLSADDQGVAGQQVAVAPDGTTTVVWSRSNGTNLVVQASTRAPGGAFNGPVNVSASGQTANYPQVAVAPDGTTTVVWYRFNGTRYVVQASARAPGAAFTTAVDLSAGDQDAYDPQVAVAPDGATTAVWKRFNGTNYIIQAAFTANPPALRAAPKISGAAALGASLGCDGGLWTGAAQLTTSWLRAATQVADGPTYTITTSDQGSALSCQARASNPYGSVQALSTPLSIPTAPTPPVPPAPPAPPAPPSARSMPKLTGSARLGRTLRCKPASFTGATNLTTSWLRGTRPIKGARKTTYKITKKDLGKIISCRTTATGPGGTSTTISPATLARR